MLNRKVERAQSLRRRSALDVSGAERRLRVFSLRPGRTSLREGRMWSASCEPESSSPRPHAPCKAGDTLVPCFEVQPPPAPSRAPPWIAPTAAPETQRVPPELRGPEPDGCCSAQLWLCLLQARFLPKIAVLKERAQPSPCAGVGATVQAKGGGCCWQPRALPGKTEIPKAGNPGLLAAKQSKRAFNPKAIK